MERIILTTQERTELIQLLAEYQLSGSKCPPRFEVYRAISAELTEQITEEQLSGSKCSHFHYFTHSGEELKFERVRKGRWRNEAHDITIIIPI